MNFFQNEFSILNSIFSSVPFTLPILVLIYYYFIQNKFILYLFIGTIIINFICIPFVKELLIPIGIKLSDIYKTDDIPFIGRFKRPIGSTNTGCFYISDDAYSYTTGMPSGHCMLTTFTITYLYYYIIHTYKISKKHRPFIFCIMLMISIYMAYTRVLMNCHTIQQTIIGSIIGYILGYSYYFYIIQR